MEPGTTKVEVHSFPTPQVLCTALAFQVVLEYSVQSSFVPQAHCFVVKMVIVSASIQDVSVSPSDVEFGSVSDIILGIHRHKS